MSYIKFFIYFMVFSVFVLAPVDIVLNFRVLGFNVRLVGILLAVLVLLSFFVLIKEREKLSLPVWVILLVFVCVINSIFVFNSILITRGIMYAIWFWLFVIFVISFINLRNVINLDIVLKLYVFSFLVHAMFGIIQQIGYYLLQVNIFATQPGRVNGLTYEPSYFATYISPSMVLVVLASLFVSNESKLKWLFYVSVGFITSVSLVSTSKMFIVIWILSGFSFLLLIIIILYFNKFRDIVSVAFNNLLKIALTSLLVVFGVNFILNYLPTFLSASAFTVREKNREIMETRQETSFGPRIEEFKKTLQVAFENPIIGTSLGGVAPHKAIRQGVMPQSNLDVKQFEGMSIYAEMLAGFGFVGFIIFIIFILKLTYDSARVILKLIESDNIGGGVILFALISGLFIELLTLVFNQNILRFYLWNHIAVLGLFLEKYRLKIYNQSV
ncbi:MAG: hypothetical protein N2712_04320 [Brevinematales bacterium]|nr:hypothetical protein [Brevinematales bacterium]